MAALNQQGVTISDDLKVAFNDEAKVRYSKSPYARDLGADVLPCNRYDFTAVDFHGRGLQARICRVAAAVRAADLHTGTGDASKKRALLSASGPSVGQFWVTAPTSQHEAFENLWFRTSLRQRLHLCTFSSGRLCQLRRTERGDELCLKKLSLEHVYCCPSGVARFRPHRHLSMALAHALRDLGAFVGTAPI